MQSNYFDNDVDGMKLEALINKVNQTYFEADKERYWLEQSLTITSQEMADLYEKLAMDSQARIKAISSALPDMMFFADEKHQVLEVFGDNEFKELINGKFEGLKLALSDYFYASLADKVKNGLNEIFNGENSITFNFEQNASEIIKHFEVRLIKTDIVINGALTVIGMIRDVSNEVVKQQLATLINQIIQHSKEAVIILDHKGLYTFANTTFKKLFDNTEYCQVGEKCHFLEESIQAELAESVWGKVNVNGIWKGEWQIQKDNQILNLNMQFEQVKLDKGRVYHIAVINDITELQYSRDELMHVAYHDFLTGLPNRKFYYEKLKNHLSQPTGNFTGAILFFDLDRFKTVNDSLGHRVGDELLIKVANRITAILKDNEFFARMGGDEFTVLHHDAKSMNDINDCAERILQAFEAGFKVEHHEIEIKTSIGISTYPNDSIDVDDLTQFADTAMYDAKNNGGNSYKFFSQSLKHSVLLNFRLEQELRKAISNNQLMLYYQPQVEHNSGKIVTVEALSRWKYKGEFINPEVFIPIAEASGLIYDLGLWVLDTACFQFNAWLEQGIELNRIAVNISRIQLGDPDFYRKVLQCLKKHQIDGHRLELEITENALLENSKLARQNIENLTKHNIWLSVDDFGTGHSSLSNLSSFPFKSIKIDKGFVAGIGKNLNDEVIIKTTMAMAKELDLEVVAEGVENYTQMVFLKSIGCHYQQGYYFSEPLPAASLNLAEVIKNMQAIAEN